ncbi:DJ-1/PfpI family protein [Streptomyces sp. NPDC005953]|uniref:DJ-1/PfpI family protein n=1 Tax=Streptomyces sp. NPDC005953 TaxID=3156719 RepID=UPI003404A7AD
MTNPPSQQTPSTTRRTLLRTTAAGVVLASTGLAGSAAAHAASPVRPGPRIGILLYDGFSVLDATGPAEVLSRLPGADVTMVAQRRGPVTTDTGDLRVMAERSIADVKDLDVLLVPGAGNRGTTSAIANQRLLEWIRRMHRRTQWTTSVCTGSLVLAAAGLLEGRKATTYWASAPYLESVYGVTYLPERYVRSGKIITAAGVSAGLDMALHLSALLAGDNTARAIQLALEYDPQPPFDSGNAATAEPWLKELALDLLARSQN